MKRYDQTPAACPSKRVNHMWLLCINTATDGHQSRLHGRFCHIFISAQFLQRFYKCFHLLCILLLFCIKIIHCLVCFPLNHQDCCIFRIPYGFFHPCTVLPGKRPSTWSARSHPCGFSPTPTLIRIKFEVPTLEIMLLIPLCPPALPFLRTRIFPGAKEMSSK